MLLYKTKYVSLCLCKNSLFTLTFPKGNYKYASRFIKFWTLATLFFFMIEVFFTCLDLIMTPTTYSADGDVLMQSTLENFDLDLIQLALTAIVMY